MVLFAMSFNIMFGYTGLLSISQAAFFGIGGYSIGYIFINYTQSYFIGVILAIAITAIVALVIGYLCVRLDGLYFALLSLSFGMMIFTIFYRWRSVTGGDDGLIGIPTPVIEIPYIFSKSIVTISEKYYFILITVIICIFLIRIILKSPFGMIMQATRDNPLRIQFLGFSMRKIRLISFVISCIFAGIAGTLYVPLQGAAYPDMSNWVMSALAIKMTILGGAWIFGGPIVGATIFVILQHYVITNITGRWMLVFGSLMIICVLYFPNGILPYVLDLYEKIKSFSLKAGGEKNENTGVGAYIQKLWRR